MSNVQMRNETEALKTLFMSNVMKAKFRNQILLNECEAMVKEIDSDKKYKRENAKRFKILKENYLSMIKSVYPVWQSDLEEYKIRHKKKSVSVNLPPPMSVDVVPQQKNKIKTHRSPKELMNEIELKK